MDGERIFRILAGLGVVACMLLFVVGFAAPVLPPPLTAFMHRGTDLGPTDEAPAAQQTGAGASLHEVGAAPTETGLPATRGPEPTPMSSTPSSNVATLTASTTRPRTMLTTALFATPTVPANTTTVAAPAGTMDPALNWPIAAPSETTDRTVASVPTPAQTPSLRASSSEGPVSVTEPPATPTVSATPTGTAPTTVPVPVTTVQAGTQGKPEDRPAVTVTETTPEVTKATPSPLSGPKDEKRGGVKDDDKKGKKDR